MKMIKPFVALAGGLAIMFMAPDFAVAAGGKVQGPNAVAPDRYVYYPGTEVLAKDEIRVIACGTGMPAARRGRRPHVFWWKQETATSSFSILARARRPTWRR